MLRPETASLGLGQTCPDRPEASHSGKNALKVIASSIRKGNIIEQDGRHTDIVVLACPLNAETENLIDAKALAALKPTAEIRLSGSRTP